MLELVTEEHLNKTLAVPLFEGTRHETSLSDLEELTNKIKYKKMMSRYHLKSKSRVQFLDYDEEEESMEVEVKVDDADNYTLSVEEVKVEKKLKQIKTQFANLLNSGQLSNDSSPPSSTAA